MEIKFIKSIILFLIAGLAEIGGGYLVWQWLREDRSIWLGLIGGIISTFQSSPNFGGIY